MQKRLAWILFLVKRPFLVVPLMLYSAWAPGSGLAQTNNWGVFGPAGGSIYTAAVDPKSPNTVYAAASLGLFKSIDGGANWRRSPGLEQVWVTSIIVDPQNSSNLYATSWARVFKSRDGGTSWNAMNFQPATGSLNHPGFFVLAIDPQNPATLYAGHSNGCQGVGCPPAGLTEGLFKSTDGGVTWYSTLLTSINVYSVAVDPERPAVLYAGTAAGLYQSTDAGDTWTQIGGIEVRGWSSLVVPDPKDASTMYIGTADGVFKSTDRGDSWNQIWRFGYVNPITSLLVDPHDPKILYAATYDGSFKSIDAGKTWQEVSPFAPSPLAWDPKTPGTVYARKYEEAVDESVLLKSTDGGTSWRRLYSGIVATYSSIAVDPQTADSVYAWTGHRLLKSTDGARRWRLVSLSPEKEGDFLGIAIDPQDSRIIYAGKQSGVFKSTDGGASWVAANTGLRAGAFARQMRTDPMDYQTVYVSIANMEPFPVGRPPAVGFWNALFKTTDGGTSWNKIGPENVFESRPLLNFAVSPHKPRTLYAGYHNSNGGVEVYRSTDGGSTWSSIAFLAAGPVTFMDITFDPQNVDVVYAVAQCALFKSTDGGTSWTAVTSRVANCLTYARIEAENGNTLYAATGGLFKSTDGGASWTYESAVRGAVSSLAVDRKSNRKYAVAQGVGVYATFDSPPQETPVPSLALSSTACIGNTWTLKVTGAQANFPIHLFGNTDGKTWEVNDWSKTDANGVYEVTGAFDKASEGRHTLYVDVDGATSNDVSFRVSSCP